MGMILKADWVVPVDKPPIAEGAVVVKEDRIVAVGPYHELEKAYTQLPTRLFACCAIIPGLINCHTHLEYSAYYDYFTPSGFGSWMLKLLASRGKLAYDDYKISSLWGALLSLRSGTTFVADGSPTGAAAWALAETGLGGRVYVETFGPEESSAGIALQELDAKVSRAAEAGVELGISPHAPYTVSPRLYREVASYARTRGLRLMTHVAESQSELDFLLYGRGPLARTYQLAGVLKGHSWQPPRMSPVELLDFAGFLGPDVLAVHCVHVTKKDIARMSRAGVAVAHCPRSNLFLECGEAPVTEMKQWGLSVGLGTDSLGSNYTLDLFSEMRATLVDHRAALRMCTVDAANALGLGDRRGSLAEGKQADLVVVKLSKLYTHEIRHATATHLGEKSSRNLLRISSDEEDSIEAQLVRYVRAQDVVFVMVDGKIMVEDGRLVFSELATVETQYNEVRQKLGMRKKVTINEALMASEENSHARWQPPLE